MTEHPHTERLRAVQTAVNAVIEEQVDNLGDLSANAAAEIVFSALFGVAYKLARQNDQVPKLARGMADWSARMVNGTMNELRIDEGGA